MILILFLFGGNKNSCWILKEEKKKKMNFAAAWKMGWRKAKVEAKRPVKRL